MQGRLLPKYQGRYQAHPLGYWQNEFPIAADLGLDCIEFILDYNDYELNPLMSFSGLKEIQQVSRAAKVEVLSVCADFFMECPFHSSKSEYRDYAVKIAKKLIQNCSNLEIQEIVIPCVDQSSISSNDDLEHFIEGIEKLLPYAEKLNINLALETDLSPKNFKCLLDRLCSPAVTVNYDTGNSASLGYNLNEEFSLYGSRISDLHIKDRKLSGGPVFLGEGSAKIDQVLSQIKNLSFSGPIILQLYRDDEGLGIFMHQFEIFKQILDNI
jgi:L-ribulose-5-phosphate 3-epimerase